jgi:hypothetical protein
MTHPFPFTFLRVVEHQEIKNHRCQHIFLIGYSLPLAYSLELISLTYQPWNSIFLSQQISFSRFISRRNHQPNNDLAYSAGSFAALLLLNSTVSTVYCAFCWMQQQLPEWLASRPTVASNYLCCILFIY